MGFMDKNHRNPSKYVDAERGLRNWVKQQKKLMSAGALEGQSARRIFWDRGLRGWHRPARRMPWSLERKCLSIDIR